MGLFVNLGVQCLTMIPVIKHEFGLTAVDADTLAGDDDYFFWNLFARSFRMCGAGFIASE